MAGRREMAFRVVVAVLIGCAIVGLSCCLSGDGENSRASSQAVPGVDVGAEISRAVGRDEGRKFGDFVDSSSAGDPIRLRDLKGGQVSVQTVALKHVVARGEEFERENSNQTLSNDRVEDGYDGDEENSNQSINGEELASDVEHRVGKGMVASAGRRGRSLKASKRPPYPCNLPPGACGPGKKCCGSACVTVTSNHSHCGRCGHICSVKRVCCNGKCRRISTDEKNCGQCGSRCAPGVKCLFGLCGY